jgi:hypothetical protein
MGRPRLPGSQGTDDVCQCTVIPSRPPGSPGIGDHGDHGVVGLAGRHPRPARIDDCPTPSFSAILETTLLAQRVLPAGGTTEPATDADADRLKAQENPELVLLAAVAYGEASTKDVFEEMAAIANVIVRQPDARKTTMTRLLGPKSTYAFAASDGNARTKALRDADPADRLKTAGTVGTLKAAKNAPDAKGTDYSNGAYF